MSITKRGIKYWIDFSFKGRRYRFPSPENSSYGAKAYESLLRQKLLKGEDILMSPDSSPLFKDFTEKWFTNYVQSNNKPSEYKNKTSVFKVHLLPYFGKLNLDQISAYKIEEFKSLKIKTTLSPKTINKMLSCLRKALNTAQDWGLLTNVPKIKLLRVPPQKFDYLKAEEANYLLDNTTGIWHDIFLLALKTGLRFGEIIALSWDDVDFEHKLLTIRHSLVQGILDSPKSNKIRYIPMTDTLITMLQRLPNQDDYVFTLGNNKPMKQIYCIKNLMRICKELKMRRITWHVFRHSFASQLANNGVSMRVIQELLGHSDITTTMRYAHLSPATLRESIRTLDNRKAIEIDLRHKNVTIPTLEEENMALIESTNSPDIKQKTALSDCLC